MGIDVVRTIRNTWHVLDRDTGDHWESNTQQEVLDSIDAHKKAKEDAIAAAEAAKNAPTEVAEFGNVTPTEDVFTSSVPKGN